MSASPADTAQLASAMQCVDCGKCVALCPMAEMYADFDSAMSPRGLVRQVLDHPMLRTRADVGLTGQAETFPALAGCVQCRSCSQTCPEAVDPAGLIARLRQMVGWTGSCCPCCGTARPPERARNWLERSTGRSPGEDDAYLGLCPSCRRQMYIRNNR